MFIVNQQAGVNILTNCYRISSQEGPDVYEVNRVLNKSKHCWTFVNHKTDICHQALRGHLNTHRLTSSSLAVLVFSIQTGFETPFQHQSTTKGVFITEGLCLFWQTPDSGWYQLPFKMRIYISKPKSAFDNFKSPLVTSISIGLLVVCSLCSVRYKSWVQIWRWYHQRCFHSRTWEHSSLHTARHLDGPTPELLFGEEITIMSGKNIIFVH